ETEFRRWCLDAQSLHPTVLVALPYLFRRWAQHERSLFAYLFSSEPFAVPDVLARAPSRPVRLHDLYEYVAEHAIGSWNAPALMHTITVAQEVLARLKDPSPLQVQIIQTVAIISILGEGCPVRPTLPHIAFALDEPPAEIADALQTLIQQGVLTYRSYNQCYYLWEGSHIDLEERLQKYRAHAVAGVAEQLTQIYPLPPLVAHRHSYDFGVLRYFETCYCETPTPALPPRLKHDAAGQVLVCLPRSNAEHAQFCEWAQSDLFREAFDRVVVVAAPAPRLHEILQDYIALWQLLHQDEAVQQDPIACREVEARLNELQSLVRTQLQRALGLTTRAERTPLWFYRSQPLGAVEGRGVSQRLSTICDAIYHASPRLRNELIQRRQLSSAVAAARRNLIEAMLHRAHLPRLGIQGHPPELSLYRSLLEATQLHRPLPSGEWGFASPEPDSDPARLRPVWEHLHQRILSAFPEQIPLPRLIAELESPPYGVLPSVFPILLCALWLVYRDELSLYREGRFIPEPTIADWELLLRRPDLFSVGGVRITAAEQAILDTLSTVLATEPRLGAVVRGLVRRLRSLPEYALRTRQLPQPSLALRETVVNASSPERLIFHDLPAALGVDVAAQNAALQLARQLQAALEDIERAYPQLLRRARHTILSTLGFPDTDSGWRSFLQMCRDNKERVFHPMLKPLLYRAAATTDEQSALESMLAYITGRPPRAWSDIDTERFVQQFQAIAKLLQEQLGEVLAPMPPEKEQQAREIARQIYAALVQHPQPIDAELLRAILRHVEHLHLTRQEFDNVESTTNCTEVE
ncbi:MAG: hypothetical protein NZM28_01920, partial [Fimbriimonadales bacterium]|nr:hypothetical protein [Fimbriimonadales bacterium]